MLECIAPANLSVSLLRVCCGLHKPAGIWSATDGAAELCFHSYRAQQQALERLYPFFPCLANVYVGCVDDPSIQTRVDTLRLPINRSADVKSQPYCDVSWATGRAVGAVRAFPLVFVSVNPLVLT